MNMKPLSLLSLLVILLLSASYVITSPPPASTAPELKVLLGGDIYVGNRIMADVYERGIDYYTASLRTVIDRADLHIANLEAPITTEKHTTVRKQYIFQSHPELSIGLLKNLGIDGVSLANNHILDYGAIGLFQTMRALHQSDIKYAGAGANNSWARRPALFEKNGQKIGLLAFSNTYPVSFWSGETNPGTAYGSESHIRESVKSLDQNVDHVIVSFHWGGELDTEPKQYQVRLARAAIEEGADVVFGHHPHTIQPVEHYRDGLILYSLGNYFFTTMSPEVNYGLLAELTLADGRPPLVNFHLLDVNNLRVRYQPRLLGSYSSSQELARYINRPGFIRVMQQARAAGDK